MGHWLSASVVVQLDSSFVGPGLTSHVKNEHHVLTLDWESIAQYRHSANKFERGLSCKIVIANGFCMKPHYAKPKSSQSYPKYMVNEFAILLSHISTTPVAGWVQLTIRLRGSATLKLLNAFR
jgi:hypothetical protein